MKKTIIILFVLLGIISTVQLSCKKLPRDNPLDIYYNEDDGEDVGVKLVFSKYVVSYDDNIDGIINPNETVYLLLYIKNTGNSEALGVNASISTGSNYISNLEPATSIDFNSGYGSSTIQAGGEDFGKTGYTPNYNDYTIKFNVNDNVTDGTVITFNMLIRDENGREWQDTFTIEVHSTDAVLNFSKYSVAYDNNLDDIINQGETAYLRVYVKNNGSSQANGVKASIGASSSYILNLSPGTELSYNSGYGNGDIVPGSEKFGKAGYTPDYDDYTVKFDIAGNTPDDTEITFYMNISDENGNEWQDTFMIEVKATDAILNFSKYVLVYDDNQNGQINPGETAYLRVFVKNNGTSQANDVKASISTSSSFVSTLEPTYEVTYNSGYGGGTILPGIEKYGKAAYAPNYDDYTVNFTVNQNTPTGTDITFNILITDEEGNEWEDAFTIQVSAKGFKSVRL